MAWLTDPSLPEAAEFLGKELRDLGLNGRSLLLVGRCRIDYEGRAQSQLAEGDRIILVKSDGTLLIHNPAGLKPVNWQPPGCAFTCRATSDVLVVEARRKRPIEVVELRFAVIHLLGSIRLDDAATLQLQGTEFDIRDTLRAHPELVEPGFVPWERERITERGPMDLYGEDAQGRRVIIEVKRTRAGIAEATQLWRYVEKERTKRDVEVRGILVAPAASDRALLLLKDHGLEFRVVDWDTLRQRKVPVPGKNQPSLLAYAQRDDSNRK